MDTTDY